MLGIRTVSPNSIAVSGDGRIAARLGRRSGGAYVAAALSRIGCVAVSLSILLAPAIASEVADAELQQGFRETVQPFVQSYCLDCHGASEPDAELNLEAYASLAGVVDGQQTWAMVLERLEAHEMPPEDSGREPPEEERDAVTSWIKALIRSEAQRNAGRPGEVLARRLSNAEYNYTIRDLTGVDIQPTRDFPVDPANEAGFDNTGESLTMSPALLQKYLDAARHVADHLVLQPEGFTFAPHPVQTSTDRDKYAVERIVSFYHRQPTDYADYFFAAWQYLHRDALGNPDATIDETAAAAGVSRKYLERVWSLLEDPQAQTDVGPSARLQILWRELPAPTADDPHAAREACEQMREYVVELRKKLEPTFENLKVRGVHAGSQPFVLWKNRQYAAHRMQYDPSVLQPEDESLGEDDAERDPDLTVPSDPPERARHEASFERFAAAFPDAFYISERGRDYLGVAKEDQEQGRLLSAGFHSMMGYFRDDAPLYELILNDQQQKEIDRLWQELDFVTSAPMRQHMGFVWFERTDSAFMRDPEFDFARAEDNDVTSDEKIRKLAEVYLAKARRNGGEGVPIEAIEYHFEDINAKIRWVEQARVAAEPSHLASLVDFAERAFRRPLWPAEREAINAFYHQLREEDGISHEEAIQDGIVSVLMSPYFCYRLDLIEAGEGVRALTDYELASRLSYFLWSSMPDQELLDLAAAGELRRAEVLVSQTRRMLRDGRSRALAVEFGGNWLDFRRFEGHNSVDRERFPAFTDELRQAMFEEPIRFFSYILQENRPILEFLDAQYTFVNPALAAHYGMPAVAGDADDWTRIDNADRYGRGGILPMSVFLTQNAPGLRTSPVKRGYWVARRVLGERIPPPPPDVPELPADESQLGELSLREMLARHRDHKSCASCHERIDSLGLVFEGFGPVGERREVDLGGRPVDTHAEFPGGGQGSGIDGLRKYLQEHRREEFVDSLCGKLLSYALGRTLLLSDNATVEELRTKLAADDYRFQTLVEGIVTSPQFLTKRGRDDLQLE